MARPRKWTEEQRRESLAVYVARGGRAAAQETGVPEGTIRTWAREAGIDPAEISAAVQMQTRDRLAAARLSREERVAKLAETLLDVAEIEIVRMQGKVTVRKLAASGKLVTWEEEIPDPADRRAMMTVAAIAIDKSQLLAGAATSRTETVGDAPQHLSTLLRQIAQRRPDLRVLKDSA